MRVISKAVKSHLERNMFFDGEVEIARYDQVKYPQFEKLTSKQLGFFWRPEEVDIVRDSKDFRLLTESEQHIFTSNLKRQILLDSVQGRAPNLAFLPIVSLPELETWIETWSFSETIHSRSYTHIIRNIYSNPGDVFDTIMNIKPIVDCARDIGKYYDRLIEFPTKSNLWLALNSVNALEGIRFYVSFACSWAFAELKKMEGNAKIIKLICRDENVHLASTQQLLKLLPQDDPEFATIKKEYANEVAKMFDDVVAQEKEWADYLFKDGSMIGLNADVLKLYVDWIANKRRSAIGMPLQGKSGSNPLPWTQKWISGGDVQVAPQETEITSYVIGGVKKDVSEDTFSGLTL
jgi:ribonucleoside-diphosphate reductase beta chain